MIKKFSENINEDYFSKLASRKNTGDVRKEKQLPAGFVDLGLSVAFGPKVFVNINTYGSNNVDIVQYYDFQKAVDDSEYDAPTKEILEELVNNCDLSIDFETKLIYVKSKINGNVLELRQAEHRMPKGYGADAIQCLIWSTDDVSYRRNEHFVLEITGGGQYNSKPYWHITAWPDNYSAEFIPVIKMR